MHIEKETIKPHQSSMAVSPSAFSSGSWESLSLTARPWTPPLWAKGFAYCWSHSSDSQTKCHFIRWSCKNGDTDNSLALLPPGCSWPFMGLAKLTFNTFPPISLRSMLSIASWASADDPKVTKANPRCFASRKGYLSTTRHDLRFARTRLPVGVRWCRWQLHLYYITCMDSFDDII